MTWEDICADPRFQDFPGRIETNAQGQIIMSPGENKHAVRQGRIARLLERLMQHGEAFVECALETADGVKVADVVWATADQIARLFDTPTWPEAPAITVEVMSYSNTLGEMEAKRRLYFERGAQELWLCDELGRMSFLSPEGPLPRSRLCPEFPETVR